MHRDDIPVASATLFVVVITAIALSVVAHFTAPRPLALPAPAQAVCSSDYSCALRYLTRPYYDPERLVCE